MGGEVEGGRVREEGGGRGGRGRESGGQVNGGINTTNGSAMDIEVNTMASTDNCNWKLIPAIIRCRAKR